MMQRSLEDVLQKGVVMPEGCGDTVMKAVAFYDAEVSRGCAPEGCGDAVMEAVVFYDAEVPGGCAPEE